MPCNSASTMLISERDHSAPSLFLCTKSFFAMRSHRSSSSPIPPRRRSASPVPMPHHCPTSFLFAATSSIHPSLVADLGCGAGMGAPPWTGKGSRSEARWRGGEEAAAVLLRGPRLLRSRRSGRRGGRGGAREGRGWRWSGGRLRRGNGDGGRARPSLAWCGAP